MNCLRATVKLTRRKYMHVTERGKKKSVDLRKSRAHLRMVVRLGAGDA